jgi:hypothetical protein
LSGFVGQRSRCNAGRATSLLIGPLLTEADLTEADLNGTAPALRPSCCRRLRCQPSRAAPICGQMPARAC